MTKSGDVYEGIFRDNKVDGLCQVNYSFGVIGIGEMHDDTWTYKRTVYFELG